MRAVSKAWVLATIAAAVIAGCTADVEDTGSPPDVDVSGGEMPEVDIDPAQVDISTDTQVVEVPDVDIDDADR